MIRRGFVGIFYDTYNKGPQKSTGQYFGPCIMYQLNERGKLAVAEGSGIRSLAC